MKPESATSGPGTKIKIALNGPLSSKNGGQGIGSFAVNSTRNCSNNGLNGKNSFFRMLQVTSQPGGLTTQGGTKNSRNGGGY